MNPFATTSPTATAPATLPAAFTPEPGLPWLRTDPAMQCREAFAATWRLRLNKEYSLMAPHFPGDTEVLLSRVAGPAELVADAVYLKQEFNIPASWGPRPGQYDSALGRLVVANRCREHHTHPFAEMVMRYDNEDEAAQCSRNEDGNFYWMTHFNGFGRGVLAQQYPTYRCTIWRVTHYINAPAGSPAPLKAGMSPQQQRWYDEARLLEAGKAEEYRLHVLGSGPEDEVNVVLTGELLPVVTALFPDSIQPLPRSQAKRRRAGAVAVTTRTAYSGKLKSTTDYYRLEDMAELLHWLTSLERARRAEDAARLVGVRHQAARQLAPAQLTPDASQEAALVEESALALAA